MYSSSLNPFWRWILSWIKAYCTLIWNWAERPPSFNWKRELCSYSSQKENFNLEIGFLLIQAGEVEEKAQYTVFDFCCSELSGRNEKELQGTGNYFWFSLVLFVTMAILVGMFLELLGFSFGHDN